MNELIRSPAPIATVRNWRPVNKGSLRGFADIEFASGLIVCEISAHEANGSCWAHPPGLPQLDFEHRHRTDAAGKFLYKPALRFANEAVRKRFSLAVLEALAAAGISLTGEAAP